MSKEKTITFIKGDAEKNVNAESKIIPTLKAKGWKEKGSKKDANTADGPTYQEMVKALSDADIKPNSKTKEDVAAAYAEMQKAGE